ncbi:MAG TPA: hypothetical protein VJ992_09255 [Gemmatimonadales bacterium]|nr:hypothetical protein [Gemmatimonadales bacterium]
MSAVTVITATMAERGALLAEASASVAAQTVPPSEHLIAVDYMRRGGARVYNLLAAGVNTPWTAILPDDDVLYPNHIETLSAASEGADVVYSYCDVTGDDPWEAYNQPFSAERLRQTSCVAHVAMVRTDLIVALEGWDEVHGYDYHFWLKALDAGARFVSVPVRTWRYRLETDWRHESRGGV